MHGECVCTAFVLFSIFGCCFDSSWVLGQRSKSPLWFDYLLPFTFKTNQTVNQIIQVSSPALLPTCNLLFNSLPCMLVIKILHMYKACDLLNCTYFFLATEWKVVCKSGQPNKWIFEQMSWKTCMWYKSLSCVYLVYGSPKELRCVKIVYVDFFFFWYRICLHFKHSCKILVSIHV